MDFASAPHMACMSNSCWSQTYLLLQLIQMELEVLSTAEVV